MRDLPDAPQGIFWATSVVLETTMAAAAGVAVGVQRELAVICSPQT
ncbi:MAG: hypothetical protein M3Q71_10045 [Chloroflexota bacterium]|nr:hypothetical protein [Chloroflexota bacterium]MDP9470991.1 hypothetical protein [Chloroflexota bacterium]